MGGKFTFADTNTNFDELKGKGISGVVIKDTGEFLEAVREASGFGMEIIISLTPDRSDSIKMISPDGERVVFSDKSIEYVSLKGIKATIKRLGDFYDSICKFIVPVPEINFPIWNDALEKLCGIEAGESDILSELFCDEQKISGVRSWYMENAQKYIMKKYLLPRKNFFEKLGKKAIFDIGKAEIQYDFIRRMINPIALKSQGFSLALHPLGDTEYMGLAEDDFLIYDGYCEQLEDAGSKDILLVKPSRGIMQRYNWEEAEGSYIETPARACAFESVYFCHLLKSSGYSFDVCDEISFKRTDGFLEYRHILICPSCLFLKRELKVIEELKALGITVNSEKLLSELSQKGEEEWEKL